jgi:hypothetical protein
MGTRGPVPKRSDQRRRRNVPTGPPVERVGGAATEVPELGIPVLDVVADWYEALAEGPEALFYTPAMWQRARIVAQMLDGVLRSSRPSSQMYAALQQDMKALLVDAGELRRLGIEVQADEEDGDADTSNVVDWSKYAAGSSGG